MVVYVKELRKTDGDSIYMFSQLTLMQQPSVQMTTKYWLKIVKGNRNMAVCAKELRQSDTLAVDNLTLVNQLCVQITNRYLRNKRCPYVVESYR